MGRIKKKLAQRFEILGRQVADFIERTKILQRLQEAEARLSTILNQVKGDPSTKPRPVERRRGLRKLSTDLIRKARDDTAAQVSRIGLTFLGTAAFCLLSLLSPDSALLGGSEKINVPIAGPVSFFGFMLLGPAVLIVLRVYLQIYVEHSDRLDRLGRSVSVVRAPTLLPLQNPLIRLFSGLIFYLLLPVAMLLFAWKAAVFPAWGGGLFGVAIAVIAGHVMLPFRKFTWRSRVLLSAGGLILTWGAIFGFGLLPRPFYLERANLSAQLLTWYDLTGANLQYANLSGAHLFGADLSGADLFDADLRDADLRRADLGGAALFDANLSGARLLGADLSGAILSGADLTAANLSGTNLSGTNLQYANLRDADLSFADLSRAKGLTQKQLDEACGDADTKLPEGIGLTLKPCSTGQ
jgi:hypothetical protein